MKKEHIEIKEKAKAKTGAGRGVTILGMTSPSQPPPAGPASLTPKPSPPVLGSSHGRGGKAYCPSVAKGQQEDSAPAFLTQPCLAWHLISQFLTLSPPCLSRAGREEGWDSRVGQWRPRSEPSGLARQCPGRCDVSHAQLDQAPLLQRGSQIVVIQVPPHGFC